MDYFKHYSTASDSKSLNTIFDKFGHKGIAFWWMLVELCSENWDGLSTPDFVFHQRTVASKLKSSPNSVRPWLELCSDLGMCAFAHFETQFEIKMPKLMEIKTSRVVIKSNKKQLPVYIEENRIDIDKEDSVTTLALPLPLVKTKSPSRKSLSNSQLKEKPIVPLFEFEPLQLPEEISADEIAVKVLTAFNAICFKAFQPTRFNIEFINARLKEGFKYEDFVDVIKFKFKEWENDPKFRRYIQPSTFFNGKFDNYLNQSRDASKPILDPFDVYLESIGVPDISKEMRA